MLHPQPLCPREGGTHCFGPSRHRSNASCALNCFFPRAAPSEGASLSCKVLLSTGHFWCTWSFLATTTPLGGLDFFANVVVHFLPPSPCSVEASHGCRWPELPVSSCDPRPSQPHSSAALHLLRGLRSRQLHFPGHLRHRREYLLPSGGVLGSAPSWGLSF